MHPWARRLFVVAIAVGTAVAMFWLLLRVERPGWQTHEYGFITLYSVPVGGLVLLLELPIRRRLRRRRPLYVIAGIGAALVTAVSWTFIAYVLTGGYLLAADANPLWCWTLGALAATFANLALSDRAVAAPPQLS